MNLTMTSSHVSECISSVVASKLIGPWNRFRAPSFSLPTKNGMIVFCIFLCVSARPPASVIHSAWNIMPLYSCICRQLDWSSVRCWIKCILSDYPPLKALCVWNRCTRGIRSVWETLDMMDWPACWFPVVSIIFILEEDNPISITDVQDLQKGFVLL